MTVKNDPELDARIMLTIGMSGGPNEAALVVERMGQSRACVSDTLPTKGLFARDAAGNLLFPKMGVEIGEAVEGDGLFTHVKLPAGWRKAPTDHSMWNNLLDAEGRKRATFFYKAAFYDRDANIHACRRFTIEKRYSDLYGDDVKRFGEPPAPPEGFSEKLAAAEKTAKEVEKKAREQVRRKSRRNANEFGYNSDGSDWHDEYHGYDRHGGLGRSIEKDRQEIESEIKRTVAAEVNFPTYVWFDVVDAGQRVVYRTATAYRPDYNLLLREETQVMVDVVEALQADAVRWLVENYPDHDDPTAYW